MYNINICILYYTIRACVGEGERGCHHRYPVAGVHPGKRVCDTRVCCIIYIHMSTYIYTHENTTKNTQEFVHRTRGPRLPNPQPNPSNFNTKTPKLTMTGLYIYNPPHQPIPIPSPPQNTGVRAPHPPRLPSPRLRRLRPTRPALAGA